MNSFKLGLYTLGAYVVMSIASWAIADGLPDIYISTVFIIISVLSFVMWHEAIRKGMSKSIKDGVIVSMFFIVPYGLIVLTTYRAFFRDELRDVYKLLIWTIFNNPMRIVHYEISQLKSIGFYVFEPFLIMGILLLVNITIHLFRSKNKNV